MRNQLPRVEVAAWDCKLSTAWSEWRCYTTYYLYIDRGGRARDLGGWELTLASPGHARASACPIFIRRSWCSGRYSIKAAVQTRPSRPALYSAHPGYNVVTFPFAFRSPFMGNNEKWGATPSLRLEGVLPVICGTRRKCRKRVKDERGRGGDAKQLPYGATQPGSFRTTQRAVQEAIILGMGWVWTFQHARGPGGIPQYKGSLAPSRDDS
jgi:hypothetical protein